MSLRTKILILSVFLLSASAILFIPFVKWDEIVSLFGYISLLLGIAGSIISIFIPNSYTFYFQAESWNPSTDNEVFLEIKRFKHGMGKSPKCEVLMQDKDGYEVVICDIKQDVNGNIKLLAGRPFSGKVSIH
jgi:hypothetical protein